MRACLVPASKNLLDLAVATHEVAPPSQTSASIPCFPHVAVARRIIATVARFSWIGTSILRTAIQLVKLDDILLRQTGSSPNDIFVVPVLWHHGYFAVAESTFVVMHYRPVSHKRRCLWIWMMFRKTKNLVTVFMVSLLVFVICKHKATKKP